MTLRTASSTDAQPVEVSVGDLVIVKRNLTHPVWDGTESEVIGHARVTEIATIFEKPGRPSLPRPLRARVSNSFWYELATGLQQDCKVTRIERHPTQHEEER